MELYVYSLMAGYMSYDDAKTAILASILDGIKECRELSGAAK